MLEVNTNVMKMNVKGRAMWSRYRKYTLIFLELIQI
jgi:hypothetical protein